ncbi:uncharacterized protein LOC116853649 [Odontomachus brunneus]|uniref:uncharacterized protein LOC116853649 n=1 Tax=Odontomachus brunneus TaxID=486640 RepID=UPI0013F188E5|nr:uncharacterized protein LOC116853649 [Odontomachus brunneus]
MKIPTIIATSLLLWGFASASGPYMIGKTSASASASAETLTSNWKKIGGSHIGANTAVSSKAGTNNILSHAGASKAAATMIASAAVEAKAGLRAGKTAAEEQREALQMLTESANKNAEARILADDAAVLVQGSAEAQSVAAARTISVEETCAALGASAVEAEAAAAASKTSAGEALQAVESAAASFKTSATSALMAFKLARIQSACSANAAMQMEKALHITNEANIAAQKAMAAENAATESASDAAALQSEARDAAAIAKATIAGLITTKRNLIQSNAKVTMSNEEAQLDSKSRAADANINAIAREAAKASIRREELLEIGAEFGKADGEVITTGTRSTGGKGAIVTAEATSSASAFDIKKGHNLGFHKRLEHSSAKADADASSSIIFGGHNLKRNGAMGASASAAADSTADTFLL